MHELEKNDRFCGNCRMDESFSFKVYDIYDKV